MSRAGFYAWHTRPPALRTQQDQRLGVEIQAIHAETRQRYGSPRVHAELRDRGHRVSRKRVARLPVPDVERAPLEVGPLAAARRLSL